MKYRLLITLAVVLLAGCSPPPEHDSTGTMADRPEADGRWMIINYWAEWCHPCRKEIPELNQFARRHQENVVVYGVNYDGAQGEELAVQTNELGIEFIQLRTDPAAQLGYARPTVLPTTLVINPAGEIVVRLIGPQTQESLETAMNPDDES